MFPSPDLHRGLRVGLLGGSFNPAHAGHVELTEAARRLLRLDRVWWLVSPQNPLKETGGMAPLAERLDRARAVTRGRPWLTVSDLETSLPTRYTADTLGILMARYPATLFVWMMGADNLAGFHRWDRWTQIAGCMPVAVLSRPGYGMAALTSRAARRYGVQVLTPETAPGLVRKTAPALGFLPVVHNPLSATALRARGLGL